MQREQQNRAKGGGGRGECAGRKQLLDTSGAVYVSQTGASVGYNGMGAEGARAMAKLLFKNQCLVQLNLSTCDARIIGNNNFEDAGVSEIADVIIKHKSLASLDLGTVSWL